MGCGCSGQSSASDFAVIDYADYSALVHATGLPRPAPLGDVILNDGTRYDTQKLFLLGGKLGFAVGTHDGARGCVTIPIGGIPVRMCWSIQGTVTPPTADVTVELTFSVNNVEYYKVAYRVRCSNLPDLSSCDAELIGETVSATGLRGCNWRCLRRCAPECISCGTNRWCWALCAAVCVSRCC